MEQIHEIYNNRLFSFQDSEPKNYDQFLESEKKKKIEISIDSELYQEYEEAILDRDIKIRQLMIEREEMDNSCIKTNKKINDLEEKLIEYSKKMEENKELMNNLEEQNNNLEERLKNINKNDIIDIKRFSFGVGTDLFNEIQKEEKNTINENKIIKYKEKIKNLKIENKLEIEQIDFKNQQLINKLKIENSTLEKEILNSREKHAKLSSLFIQKEKDNFTLQKIILDKESKLKKISEKSIEMVKELKNLKIQNLSFREQFLIYNSKFQAQISEIKLHTDSIITKKSKIDENSQNNTKIFFQKNIKKLKNKLKTISDHKYLSTMESERAFLDVKNPKETAISDISKDSQSINEIFDDLNYNKIPLSRVKKPYIIGNLTYGQKEVLDQTLNKNFQELLENILKLNKESIKIKNYFQEINSNLFDRFNYDFIINSLNKLSNKIEERNIIDDKFLIKLKENNDIYRKNNILEKENSKMNYQIKILNNKIEELKNIEKKEKINDKIKNIKPKYNSDFNKIFDKNPSIQDIFEKNYINLSTFKEIFLRKDYLTHNFNQIKDKKNNTYY